MLINTHCHVFNLQSVFTPATKHILEYRMREAGLAKGFIKFISRNLENYIKNGGGLTPKERTGKSGKAFEDFIDSYQSKRMNAGDLWTFVTIALAKNMDMVTDYLLGQMDPDDIIAPLMMDITDGSDASSELFQKQCDRTLGQCLRYPGRVLPFYALNPVQPRALQRMQDVIEQGAFVGMKLYPSLGYKIKGDGKWKGILDVLELCDSKGFPVMQHASQGGFYANKYYILNGFPGAWIPYLFRKEKPYLDNIRVCFAHFGGKENEVAASTRVNAKDTWARVILRMMDGSINNYDAGPSDRIFTDVSCMADAAKTTGYFKALNTYLRHETYGSQILWGSDYFLVEMSTNEENFRTSYQSGISRPKLWKRLTLDNPRRFLGLNLADPMRSEPNILAHIAFLRQHKSKLNMKRAAEWVKGVV